MASMHMDENISIFGHIAAGRKILRPPDTSKIRPCWDTLHPEAPNIDVQS